MEDTDYQRLCEVKKYLQFQSWTDFQQALGLKNSQIFTDIKTKKSRRISSSLAEKIVNYAPDISFEWLLTGRGPMITATAPAIVQNNVAGDNNNSGSVGVTDSEALTSLIDTNRQLVEQQGRLIEIIEKLTLK